MSHEDLPATGNRERWFRPRSLLTLLPVAIIPPTCGSTAVGAALAGGRGAVFGAILGVVLGLLAAAFAVVLGWFTHRAT
jgi:hypothetical protein